MKSSCARREHGAALLALVAVLALGSSWYLVSRLNAESGMAAAARTARNAEVLNRAKEALIGYVAAQAANAGQGNPGALPCPEAPGYFDNPGQEGQTASGCTLPAVGRFPWRTIGTEKLLDSAGEPLWYVVSPGWARTSGNTNINSNTLGQLTVDGTANDAVALIIAPGPAFRVPACAGNAAHNQVRPTTGTPDWRNYLECENATHPTPNTTFVTRGPSGSFNDQVMRITVADIMPGIEAAIAKRIERDIVPVLKTVYAGSDWGTSPSSPLYPFAAPFSNPGTSDFRGAAGTYAGLLPFSHTTAGCNPATDPRCAPTFVSWTTPRVTQTGGSGMLLGSPTCAGSGTESHCIGQYSGGPVQIKYEDRMANVANALRRYSLKKDDYIMEVEIAESDTGPWSPIYSGAPSEQTRHFNSDGSFSFAFIAPTLPTYSDPRYYRIKVTRDAFSISDHALLDANDPVTGWFVRNEWYRLAYYVVAQGHTAATSPPSCTTGSNCLSVTNVTPAGAQRAILILAGRSVNGTNRPSAMLADYLESGNATGAFVRRTANASVATPVAQRFNDRIVVIDSN